MNTAHTLFFIAELIYICCTYGETDICLMFGKSEKEGFNAVQYNNKKKTGIYCSFLLK